MTENFNDTIKVYGLFKIESFKQGKLIDTIEQKNLIMDLARNQFAKFCGGIVTDPINKLVLGTQGHVGSDTDTPKTSTEGFISSRTNLFSEVSGTNHVNFENFSFTPNGISGSTVTCTDGVSTANISSLNNIATFIVDIPENVGNGTGSITFTEAALYTGTNIFSMRTFKGRLKDNSIALRITWKIIF